MIQASGALLETDARKKFYECHDFELGENRPEIHLE